MSHSERAHAKLSASGAKRWMACPPSADLEDKLESQTSIYAEEGTFMHELSEFYLHSYLGNISKAEFNRKLRKMKKNKFYTKEIENAVKDYLDIVIEKVNEAKSRSKDAVILIEQRLDYSQWVPEGFGTADTLIISDGVLEVIDLKGGKGVAVSAVDNPQMKLYALGGINQFSCLYDIDHVKMTISQPRLDTISTYELAVGELLKWAEEEVKPKAELAFVGDGEFLPGEHCRFCKVNSICRSRCNKNMELALLDFKKPPLLTEEEIVQVLESIDDLQKWASDVQAYAYDKSVNEGKKWPGFKLVEGRGSRKYSSETEVAKVLLEAGYEEEKIYSKSLLNLTALEKKIGKKQFKEILGDLITRAPGKLKLVSEDDKRPEVKSTAEADFTN